MTVTAPAPVATLPTTEEDGTDEDVDQADAERFARMIEELYGTRETWAVYTDRNAALAFARYSSDLADIDSLVDWPLMEGKWFNNTPADPDRLERRMAELPVHEHVPWSAILGIAVRTEARAGQASAVLASVGLDSLPVRTRADWYF